MRNTDIRTAAEHHNVRLWEIADAIGMTDSSFSRKLRYELDEKEKSRLINVISEIANRKERENNAEHI